MPVLDVLRMFDNKLSVRVNKREVYLLPNKLELSADDIARMLRAVVEACVVDEFEERVTEQVKEDAEELRREASRW